MSQGIRESDARAACGVRNVGNERRSMKGGYDPNTKKCIGCGYRRKIVFMWHKPRYNFCGTCFNAVGEKALAFIGFASAGSIIKEFIDNRRQSMGLPV